MSTINKRKEGVDTSEELPAKNKLSRQARARKNKKQRREGVPLVWVIYLLKHAKENVVKVKWRKSDVFGGRYSKNCLKESSGLEWIMKLWV